LWPEGVCQAGERGCPAFTSPGFSPSSAPRRPDPSPRAHRTAGCDSVARASARVLPLRAPIHPLRARRHRRLRFRSSGFSPSSASCRPDPSPRARCHRRLRFRSSGFSPSSAPRRPDPTLRARRHRRLRFRSSGFSPSSAPRRPDPTLRARRHRSLRFRSSGFSRSSAPRRPDPSLRVHRPGSLRFRSSGFSPSSAPCRPCPSPHHLPTQIPGLHGQRMTHLRDNRYVCGQNRTQVCRCHHLLTFVDATS